MLVGAETNAKSLCQGSSTEKNKIKGAKKKKETRYDHKRKVLKDLNTRKVLTRGENFPERKKNDNFFIHARKTSKKKSE